MTLTAEVRIKMTASQTGSNDLATPRYSPVHEFLAQFASGTGANQADLFWGDTRTLAASATEDLDIAGVLTDAFGATITAAEVVAIMISADAANTNNVVVGDATAPVPLFGGTNPTRAIRPGGCDVYINPGATGLFTVGAGTTDDLKIANSSSGTAVTYTISILARTA